MTTISARIDDTLKQSAQEIADELGISLSTVINIFLRKFIAEQGFPFEVKVAMSTPLQCSEQQITAAIRESVKSPVQFQDLPNHTYLDPDKNELISIESHTVT